MINIQQQEVLDFFKNSSKSIALLGAAGTGKSFVFKKMIEIVANEPILITAMTGVAASLINGRSLHSSLGLGFSKDDEPEQELILKIENNPQLFQVWSSVKILFVDEISMMTAKLFDKLNSVAKKIRKSTEFFGGIRLVLCGDFLQLAPINIELGFAFESFAWKELVPFYLRTQMRQQADLDWAEMLDRIRKAQPTNSDLYKLSLRKGEAGPNDVLIFCKNNQVNYTNLKKLQQLGTKMVDFVPSISATKGNISQFERENFLSSYPKVTLAIGAKVMHTENNYDLGIFNGSIGTILDILNDQVIVDFKSKTVTVKNTLKKIDLMGVKIVKISSMPLKLAWATTVHKIQGATLEEGCLDLSDAFANSQVYTALSRFPSINCFKLVGFRPDKIRSDIKCIKFFKHLEEE